MTGAAPAPPPRADIAALAGGPAALGAGIEIVDVGPGHARLRMTVTDAMLNSYGSCHGGYLFLLADTALGVAANAQRSVSLAMHAEIVFMSPVGAGSVLDARATEIARYGAGDHNGVYDIQVTDSNAAPCAQMRGTVRVRRTG